MTKMYQQREIFEAVNLFLCIEDPNKFKSTLKPRSSLGKFI